MHDISTFYFAVKACTEGDIHLVNGGAYYRGRVEVCYNNTWRTVCHRNWNANAGIVACRQLGLRFVASDAYFGPGTGQVRLNSFYCSGSETRLIDCYNVRFNGMGNCYHSNDAGLICEGNLINEYL